MKVLCIGDFKKEYEKLIKSNAYSDLKETILAYFFDKSYDALFNGTNLNRGKEPPFIKKRLKGSGGYRAYFLLMKIDDVVLLLFVHPKSGKKGTSNLQDGSFKHFLKKGIECLEEKKDLWEIERKGESPSLTFTKVKKAGDPERQA